MSRKPIGTYVRKSEDWFVHRINVRQGFTAGIGGQYSYVGVYNNTTAGEYLIIPFIRFEHVTEKAPAYFGQTQGNVGNLTLPGRPIDALQPVGSGLFGAFTSATDYFQVGGTFNTFGIAELGSPDLQSYDWQGNFPLAAVAPGWSALLESKDLSESLTATFWWYAVVD